MTDQKPSEPQSISFISLISSVFSAFLGVQSNANRQRDFSQGKMSHFIFIGLLLGLIFVLSIVGVVFLVLELTGT